MGLPHSGDCDDFNEKQYIEFNAPFVGTKWVRDKTIFDYLGIIDYDMEWYNGMNMAGLWSYAYYSHNPAADRLIKDRWPLIREIQRLHRKPTWTGR